MSDYPKTGLQEEGLWPKLDMDSANASPRQEDENGESFIHLQPFEEKKGRFVPLIEDGNEPIKEKTADDLLRKSQEKQDQLEKEAYLKGFSQGEKDGFELGEKRAGKVLENLEALLRQIGGLKEELVRQYEKEILSLIMAVAEKIVHCRIERGDKIIREAVLHAIPLVSEKTNVDIRINPEDYDSVETLKPDIFSRFKGTERVTIKRDPTITRGGCFIETPYGNVDARVESQLEKVCQCLDEAFVGTEDERAK